MRRSLARIMTVDNLEDCRIAAIEGIGALKAQDPRIYHVLIEGMEHDDPAIRLDLLPRPQEDHRQGPGESTRRLGVASWSPSSPRRRSPRRPGPPTAAPIEPSGADVMGGVCAIPPSPLACLALESHRGSRHGRPGTSLAIMDGSGREPGQGHSCRSGARPWGRSGSLRVRGAASGRESSWTRTRWNCWNSTRSAPWSPRGRPARWARTAARRMEPSRDPGEIRDRQALTTEMAEALAPGLTPPFGGLHDIRPLVRRAQVGAIARGRGAGRDGRDAPGDRQPRPLARPDRRRVPPARRAQARASASSRASSTRSRRASTAGARSSTPPAASSRRSAARSARSRSGSRRRSGGCSARPRSGGSSAIPTSRWSATTTSCRSPRSTGARSRARSTAPAPATRRSSSSRRRSPSSRPSSRSSAPARPRRSAGSSAGSAPRSARSPTRCSARWRPWPSST